MQFRCVQGNVCQLRTLAHNICTWHCTVRVPDPSSHYQFECVHVLFILATEHWLRTRRTLISSWRVPKLSSSHSPQKVSLLTDSYDHSSIHNVSTYIFRSLASRLLEGTSGNYCSNSIALRNVVTCKIFVNYRICLIRSRGY